MLKLIRFVLALSALNSITIVCANVSSIQMMENTLAGMHQESLNFLNYIQSELNQAGTDTNRYVRAAEYTGNTSHLVQDIDDRFNQFSINIKSEFTILFNKKYAILMSGTAKLCALIQDTNRAKDVRSEILSNFKNAKTSYRRLASSLEIGVRKIMHDAAEQSIPRIQAAIQQGSNIYGVPEADATIYLGLTNANQTYHDRLNVVNTETQEEVSHYLKIAESLLSYNLPNLNPNESVSVPIAPTLEISLPKSKAIENRYVSNKTIYNVEKEEYQIFQTDYKSIHYTAPLSENASPIVILNRTLAEINGVTRSFLNDIQIALNQAAAYTVRNVYEAENTGNTSDLLQIIDKRYSVLAKMIEKYYPRVVAKEKSILNSGASKISSNISDKRQADKVHKKLTTTLKHLNSNIKVDITKIENEIMKIMHDAAEEAVQQIDKSVVHNSNIFGVPQADAAIHLGLMNSNKTYHNHRQVINSEIQNGESEFLRVIESSLSTPGFFQTIWNTTNDYIIQPVGNWFSKMYRKISSL